MRTSLPILTYPAVFAAPVGGDPLEIRRDLWYQKTRVPGLSYGVVSAMLYLGVLVQYSRSHVYT